MSIPRVLALDLEYNIDEAELEKTVNLNLNINKENFIELNTNRKENSLPEITLEDIQKIIVKGNVKYIDNNFEYIIDPKEDEKELYALIKPLLEITMSFFNNKTTEFIHLAPDFNQLMDIKNYETIVNKYYQPIKKHNMTKELSDEANNEIESGTSKYSILFKTLLNEPLKQLRDIFLPSINTFDESLFYQEKDSIDSKSDRFYKYLTYIPENYLWNIPVSLGKEEINVKNITFKLRYLSMDEITHGSANNNYDYLLEDTNYLDNLCKIITTETIDMTHNKPFESSWSTDNIKQTNSLVETNVLPKLLTNEDGEIVITKPEEVKVKLLKPYLGIHHKFFDQKILIETKENSITGME
jgi:hypothetical protein